MSNMVDFIEKRKRIIKERTVNGLKYGTIDPQRNLPFEDFKKDFLKIFEYHGFDDAYSWLYDQILCSAGLIEEDDCYPMFPCTPEEIAAFEKEREENAISIEEARIINKGPLPFE